MEFKTVPRDDLSYELRFRYGSMLNTLVFDCPPSHAETARQNPPANPAFLRLRAKARELGYEGLDFDDKWRDRKGAIV